MSDAWEWEVLTLVAQHLDPKTIALASCVSGSWFSSMSSDQIWQPICTAHFPCLSSLNLTHHHAYRRLYALAVTATRRRLKPPSKPRISPHNLLFAIHLRTRDVPLPTIATPADDLCPDTNGFFRFDIDVRLPVVEAAAPEEVRITWNVVLRGWQGLFTMIDCEGMPGAEGWFSEELPSPGCCCSSGVSSGIVAELKLGFCSSNEVRVDKISVGILDIVNWRYVSVDDALRYLQHYLLTN